jgi:hypothetical protein
MKIPCFGRRRAVAWSRNRESFRHTRLSCEAVRLSTLPLCRQVYRDARRGSKTASVDLSPCADPASRNGWPSVPSRRQRGLAIAKAIGLWRERDGGAFAQEYGGRWLMTTRPKPRSAKGTAVLGLRIMRGHLLESHHQDANFSVTLGVCPWRHTRVLRIVETGNCNALMCGPGNSSCGPSHA